MPRSWSVTTWNVNSVRARLDHVSMYLAEHEPDVLLLQETKVEDALFPRVPFLELGYHVETHGSKGYAGVATVTRRKPDSVQAGFRDGKKDRHCRLLEVDVDGVAIFNVYVPNGTELGSDAFAYKLAWLDRLRGALDTHHAPDHDVIVAGDFNIAPDERDVHDPEAMAGALHFSEEEHAALGRLREFGLEDCFRAVSDESGVYSWYDYRMAAFERGRGLRIDQIYATAPLAENCKEVIHDAEPRGWDTPSDHLPVTAVFERR